MRLALVLVVALITSCGAPSPARAPSGTAAEAPIVGEELTLDVPELL